MAWSAGVEPDSKHAAALMTPTNGVHADEMPRTRTRARLVEQPLAVATAFCLTLGSFAGLILYLGRGLTFWRDEWFFVQYRTGHSEQTLFSPHGGHLALAAIVIYKLLFKVAGLETSHYWAYRCTSLVFLLANAVLLWEIGRRRVGPAAAIVPVASVLFLGPGWEALVWPFQIVFTGALAAGLGMLLALERRDLRGDMAACLLLGVSLSFSGVGLAFAAGALVDVMLRPSRWRRAWIFTVPLLLWAVWYYEYGRFDNRASLHNVANAPAYVLRAAGAAVGAVTGAGSNWGKVVAVVLVLAVAARVARRGWGEPRLWSTVVLGLSFWFSLALGAHGIGYEPDQSRYVFPGAVFVWLVLLEVTRGYRPTNAQFLLALVLLGIVLAVNVPKLVDGTRVPRKASATLTPELGAIELARNVVDPYFTITRSDTPIVAAWYLAAVDRWGSPADTPAQIARRPEQTREQVDADLVAAMRIRPRPVTKPTPAGSPPSVSSSRMVSPHGNCVRLGRKGQIDAFNLTLHAPMLAVRTGSAPARLAVRRFADNFAVSLGRVGPHRTARVAFPPDSAPEPWRLKITGPAGVEACSVR